jgi:hypothetical protein
VNERITLYDVAVHFKKSLKGELQPNVRGVPRFSYQLADFF